MIKDFRIINGFIDLGNDPLSYWVKISTIDGMYSYETIKGFWKTSLTFKGSADDQDFKNSYTDPDDANNAIIEFLNALDPKKVKKG